MFKSNKTAGVDEVGRGCLAGPVFAAAVILNNKINTKNIKDSKNFNINFGINLNPSNWRGSVYLLAITITITIAITITLTIVRHI